MKGIGAKTISTSTSKDVLMIGFSGKIRLNIPAKNAVNIPLKILEKNKIPAVFQK